MKLKPKSIVIRRETYNQILRLLVLDRAEESKNPPLKRKNYPSGSRIYIVHTLKNIRIVVKDYSLYEKE